MSVRWRRWLGFALLSVAALYVAGLLLIETGIMQRWERHIVVSQIEQRTGARVDLGGFHLHASGNSAQSLTTLRCTGLKRLERRRFSVRRT